MNRGDTWGYGLLWGILAAGLGGGVLLALWLAASSLPDDSPGWLPSSAWTPCVTMTVTPQSPWPATAAVISAQAPPTPSTPVEPRATPRPSDPYRLSIGGYRTMDTKAAVQEATIIATGTIKQVLPARWTTPDGRRPENPHALGSLETIFRPVVMEVERYHLTSHRSQSELVLFAFGGTVGQDSVKSTISDVYVFQEGQHVIVFLVDKGLTLDGAPLWNIVERYTLTPQGQATNSLRTLPLAALLEEIDAALHQ